MKKRVLVLLSVCIVGLFLFYLYFSGDQEIIIEKNRINLNEGTIVEDNYGDFKFYNLSEGKYNLIEIEDTIAEFNKLSGNYIYNNDNVYMVNYYEEKSIIDTLKVNKPKLSKDGEYLSYFIRDIYYELKIKDLKNNEYIEFKSDVAISGDLVDWISEDTLIYYGIDSNKNNGLFTFNVKTLKEKFLYNLEVGYIEYLEVLDNEIAFIQEEGRGNKSLKLISLNGQIKEMLEEIYEVSDVEKNENGIYILGKISGNNYSLYKYSDGKFKRLIFDFPKIINLEKGLSKDSNGNILFMGSDNDYSVNNIYICIDDSISLLNSNGSNYYFIEFN